MTQERADQYKYMPDHKLVDQFLFLDAQLKKEGKNPCGDVMMYRPEVRRLRKEIKVRGLTKRLPKQGRKK